MQPFSHQEIASILTLRLRYALLPLRGLRSAMPSRNNMKESMKSEYTSDELLPLSGIQHFLFCRRQWALIHVERQWQENAPTAEGRIMHKRVDDPFFTETRNG